MQGENQEKVAETKTRGWVDTAHTAEDGRVDDRSSIVVSVELWRRQRYSE